MTPDEIKKTCDEVWGDERFEILSAASVTPEQVKAAVDEDTADGYGNWIYFNEK